MRPIDILLVLTGFFLGSVFWGLVWLFERSLTAAASLLNPPAHPTTPAPAPPQAKPYTEHAPFGDGGLDSRYDAGNPPPSA